MAELTNIEIIRTDFDLSFLRVISRYTLPLGLIHRYLSGILVLNHFFPRLCRPTRWRLTTAPSTDLPQKSAEECS